MEFRRHSLVHLSADGWERVIRAHDLSLHPTFIEWQDKEFPLVVRRQKGIKQNEVAVGIPVNIGFTIEKRDVLKLSPPLELKAAIGYVPSLAKLLSDLEEQGLSCSLFGSLAWQALTGRPYLHDKSDIDLLFFPKTKKELTQGLKIFQFHSKYLPLDGEIGFPTGHYVAWKEWMNRSSKKLVKGTNTVQLMAYKNLHSSFETLSSQVAKLALRSLHEELKLFPKPGLVSFVDTGSHRDMSAETMLWSLFSLRHFFLAITEAGKRHAPFIELKNLGILAEARMLKATKGVNTHRGALFSLGLLCASLGAGKSLRATLLELWGKDLRQHAANAPFGARAEAALGFPTVFDLALPTYSQLLLRGKKLEHAQIDTLFTLMAHVDDTNIQKRGGKEASDWVRQVAKEFLLQGGTDHSNWKDHALNCHQQFIVKKLSPGGSADLLAATIFVYQAIQLFGMNP